MDSASRTHDVLAAIKTLYHNPDAAEKVRASMFLEAFQKSECAWDISHHLLRMKTDLETCYFATQTIRTKVLYSLHELSGEKHEKLKDWLIDQLLKWNDQNFHGITTQLCLALADLALQMTQWKDSTLFLINRFYSFDATHMPLLIKFLTFLPEEMNNHFLKMGPSRREELRVELVKAAPMVIELLIAFSQIHRNDTKICKCLVSWVIILVCFSDKEMSQSDSIEFLCRCWLGIC